MRSVAGMHGEALAALPSASKEGASLADLIAGAAAAMCCRIKHGMALNIYL